MTDLACNKKGYSFTAEGRLNSIGLMEAITAIPASILSTSAKNTLKNICREASASSGYKLFKSRNTMTQEAGVSDSTLRRHLSAAVNAGILNVKLVFDCNKGQRPNEYTFTRGFINAAIALRNVLDWKKQAAKEAITATVKSFVNALDKLQKRVILTAKRAVQNEHPSPLQNEDQLSGSGFNDPKGKDIASASAANSSVVLRKAQKLADGVKRYVVDAVTTAQEAKAERASTQAADYAQTQERLRDQRAEERQKLDALLRRRSFCNSAKDGGQPAKQHGKQSTPLSTYNAARFEEANRKSEAEYQERKRISENTSPEVTANRVAGLRAMLKNVSKK